MAALGAAVGQLVLSSTGPYPEGKHAADSKYLHPSASPTNADSFEQARSSQSSDSPAGTASRPVELSSAEKSALLAEADERLRAGNYVPALRDYLYLRETADGALSAPLQFRLALCAELAGNTSDALEAYRQLSASTAQTAWNNLALLGEVRCLITLKRHDLLQGDLLRRILLDESAFLPTVRSELMHLIARDLWTTIAPSSFQQVLNDRSMVVPVWQPDPQQQLLQASGVLSEQDPPQEKLQLTILQSTELTAEGIFLCIHSVPGPVNRLLQSILDRCRMPLLASQAAEAALEGRTQQIHVRDRSLSMLLDGMTIPFGLLWLQDGSQVRLYSSAEVSQEQRSQFQLQSAERLLRAALQEGPEVIHSSRTRLALGALLFATARTADAAHLFHMQLDSVRGTAIETETAFNLGKCLLDQADHEAARRAFLRSVDAGTSATEVRIAAYLYAGRLQIEQGNLRGALALLLRGLSLSEGSSLEADAALLLASNYLLLGSPQGANSVLMERRSLLTTPAHRDAAAFLSAYARFTATVLADRREREARSVVSTISTLRPEQRFGAHWCLLAAQAAEDIGLTQQGQEFYLLALSRAPASALRNQVLLKLAASYRMDERFREAEHLLTSLSPQEAGQFSRMALLNAAELALDLGQPASAIASCRQLLDLDASPELRRAALRVMGHAFEKLQRHEAAVYCFAGVIPDATMDPPVTETRVSIPSEGGTR